MQERAQRRTLAHSVLALKDRCLQEQQVRDGYRAISVKFPFLEIDVRVHILWSPCRLAAFAFPRSILAPETLSLSVLPLLL